MTMPRLVMGVIGHVDHGKTALVRALTGMETDRLAEEKRRGISIALGFAHFRVGEAEIDLIDMPGHERFVRTMVAGATGIDAVLLVVAATEGIKPQTVEHIDIAGLLGLRRAVVAISKTDLVSPARAMEVEAEAAALLRRAGIDSGPAVMTSAIRGDGIDALKAALGVVPAITRPTDGAAFLPIDRAFSIAGHGTIVTGTLRGGGIAAGDTLEIVPRGRAVRVRSVQVHGLAVSRAEPGQRVAANLRDVSATDLGRGDALAAVGSLPSSSWLTLELRAAPDEAPLANGTRVVALFGTTEVSARLRLLDRDVIEPGERCFAQLRLAEPAAVPARHHAIMRIASPARTVGGGMILEPQTRRHRRRDPVVLSRLNALAALSPEALIPAEIERAGRAGIALSDLARLSGLAPARVAVLADGSVIADRRIAVSPAGFDRVRRDIQRVLMAASAGLSVAALRRDVPGVSAVLAEACAALVRGGAARESGGLFSAVRLDADRARLNTDAKLDAECADLLRVAGLSPPDLTSLTTSLDRKRALDRLVRSGRVVRAPDLVQKRVFIFHEDAIEQARQALKPLLAQPSGLSVGEAGKALGISRKFCVPLLEYFDSVRFTRRIQDRRILGVEPCGTARG